MDEKGMAEGAGFGFVWLLINRQRSMLVSTEENFYVYHFIEIIFAVLHRKPWHSWQFIFDADSIVLGLYLENLFVT